MTRTSVLRSPYGQGGRAHYGAHIQFAIYLEMDLSHYLAEREK